MVLKLKQNMLPRPAMVSDHTPACMLRDVISVVTEFMMVSDRTPAWLYDSTHAVQ
jgi:hypothetical protein